VNLARMIHRRERCEGIISGFVFTAIAFLFMEGTAAYVMRVQKYWGTPLEILGEVIIATAAALPMAYVAVRINRRNDRLIALEIKCRLERPLAELFKLEHAGSTMAVEDYIDWREEYICKAEADRPGRQPIQIWIDVATRGELPTAGDYHRKYEDKALDVDIAMSLILGH
jgi:hypothetical protein